MYRGKELMQQVFPQLEDNERITVVKMNNNIIYEKHYKTVNGAMRYALKNDKYYHNTYYTVATTDGTGRKTENLISRSALVWDFDKKELGQDFSHKDIVNKFRKINLFYHAIVDSGNGYHVYVFIEPTTDLEKVKAVTEAVAIRVGADMNATLKTQLFRVPGTVNVKDPSNKKDVKVVWLDEDIKRKSIDTLASMYVTEAVKRTNIKYLMRDDHTPQCVRDRLSTGSTIGNRNDDLQRIVIALKKQGKTLAEVEVVVDEWAEVTEKMEDLRYQVKYIYENMYNGTLDCKNCPYKSECYVSSVEIDNSAIEGFPMLAIPNKDIMKIKNRKDKRGRYMNGNMIVIYTILLRYKRAMSKEEIVNNMTYKSERKGIEPVCYFSDKTIRTTLKELQDNGFIDTFTSDRKKYYILKPNRVKEELKIKISYASTYECIKGNITTRELELYCYMKYLANTQPLKKGDPVGILRINQEDLAKEVGLPRDKVNKMIRNLKDEKMVLIYDKKKSKNNNFMYNTYLLNY